MIRRHSARGRVSALILVLLTAAGVGVLALHRSDPDFFVLRLGRGGELGSIPITAEGGQGAQEQASTGAPPPESRFEVIALRPLFNPERLPPEEESAPAVESSSDGSLPDVVVTGIIIAGDDSVAMVEPSRAGSKSEKLMLRVGDTVSGWKVDKIEIDRIALVKGDERAILELKKDESPPPRRTPQRTERQPNPQQQNLPQPRVIKPAQPALPPQQPARR